MYLRPQTIVVFHLKNLDAAENFCRTHSGEWTIVCTFDTSVSCNERDPSIKYVDLFALYPYQPKLITKRVRLLINSIYSSTFLQGLNLDEALTVEGAPLLRAKDNDVMEYVLHRLVFVVDMLLQLLETTGQRKIWVLTDCGDRITLPEWPSFDRLLNLDAIYGPIFAQSAIAKGIQVNYASVISQMRSSWIHALREFALMTRRLTSVIVRGLRWRKMCSALNNNYPKIAIWVRSRGQIQEVEPMVKNWLDEGGILPFFIGDDSFKKKDCFDYLKAQKELPSVSLYAFLTPIIFIQALYLYLWFRVVGILKLKFQPITSLTGMPVDDVILSPRFRRELVKSLAESVFTSSIVAKEMVACNASLPFSTMLVLSNYDLWGNLAGYIGKAQGFKTVSIQNFNSDPWAYPTPCTLYDYHVCFDQLEKEKLLQFGASPDKVLAMGSITYSKLRNIVSQHPLRAIGRSRLSIEDRDIAILIGTQSSSDNALRENSHLLELLFKVVAEDKGVVGLVKLHPYEHISDYSRWIERVKSERLPIQFLENWNIEDAINAADAYISRFSTSLLLGIMLRKPTLSFVHPLESKRASDSVDFIRLGIIPSTPNYSEARQWVKGLHSKECVQKYVDHQEQLLAHYFTTYDEYSEKRIRNLVESQLILKSP